MGKRNRHRAERGPKIKDVELYGLEPFEGCWAIYSYYSFNTTEGKKIWGKDYTLPRYREANDQHTFFKSQKWRYPNPFVLMENPSRAYFTNWDPRLNVFYVVRILPKTYTPIIWANFYDPFPSYNQARKIVNKIKFKALQRALKCAKEDGFIN